MNSHVRLPSWRTAYSTSSSPLLPFARPFSFPSPPPLSSRSLLSLHHFASLSFLVCFVLLPSCCNGYWPTLQGNSARQGRLTYPYIQTPPSPDSFLKWSVNLTSPAYLNVSSLPPYTFGTPAVDSNGTVYAAYSTSQSPVYSGIVAISPNGSKSWLVPLSTTKGQVARGSITLSEDQSLLYFVVANSQNQTIFYAFKTATGEQAWSYTASYALPGVSDPVVFGSSVIMGDSKQLYYFEDGTQNVVKWKYLYSTACGGPNTKRVAPSVSLYNADVIFTCERRFVLSLFIDDSTLKWSTALVRNDTAGCDMTGNTAVIGDDGTIFVEATDTYNVTMTFFNETTNETTTNQTQRSDFYLFTINAGGSIRNQLLLTSGSAGIGTWQLPALGTSGQYLYVAGYLPEAYLWRVNIQAQTFVNELRLSGNASAPPIAAGDGRGYIVDSVANLYAFNVVNTSNTWITQFGDAHYHSSLAFGEDGTVIVSDSTSGGLFAYGCPTGTKVGSNGSCVACPAGTYFVTDGRALCPQCPKGKVSGGGGSLESCQFCPSDSIPSSDQTRCVACPAGMEPSYDLTTCTGHTDDESPASRSAPSLVGPLLRIDALSAF